MRTLTVYLNDSPIGVLSEGNDLWSFEYDTQWAKASHSFDLSPSLKRARLTHRDGGSDRPTGELDRLGSRRVGESFERLTDFPGD